MQDLIIKLRNSKVFGISAMYVIAALFLALTLWASIAAFKQKFEKEEKKNVASIELNEMQDSALNAQTYIITDKDGTRSIYLADENQKLQFLRNTPAYKSKLQEVVKNEAEPPTITHKFAIWALAVLLSALFTTLVIYLMTHVNIAKNFPHLAVKIAPLIFGVLVYTLTLILIYLP